MFKKGLDCRPQQTLKASEFKKLQKTQKLPLGSSLSKCHFQNDQISKGSMYFNSSNGDAVLFQVAQQDFMIPTISQLTLYPELHGLPIVMTHKAVVDRLIGGADLMIRGCVGSMPSSLVKGELCCVVDYKQPLEVIAIGECCMDVQGLKWDQYKDMHGVVVKVWTVIGDKIPSRSIDELLKERRDRIADEDILKQLSGLELSDDSEEEEGEEEEEQQKEEEEELNEKQEQHSPDRPTDFFDTVEQPDQYTLTTKDIDMFFERALLYSISQDQISLPIKSTQLIEAHILKNLPPCDLDMVNLKRSSWKKGTKFLKAMEKSKLLKLKGKDDNLTVVELSVSDDRVKNFHPYRIRSNLNKPKVAKNSNDDVDEITLKLLYKPTNPARQLYNALDLEYEQFYTKQEIQDQVKQYIAKANVVSPLNRQVIEPDDVLKDFGIKKEIKRSQIMDQIMTKYSPHHLLYRHSDTLSQDPVIQKRLLPQRGSPPKIEIHIEKLKVGKRFVTNVKHSELFFIQPEGLAAILRVKCMGSTTIQNPTNLKEGKEVSVQGRHDSSIIKLLDKEYGIKESWCQVFDYTKGKKK